MAYGLIPTLQPEGATFSRVYAVYGGVFVIMSYGWGWLIDHDRPDVGDIGQLLGTGWSEHMLVLAQESSRQLA